MSMRDRVMGQDQGRTTSLVKITQAQPEPAAVQPEPHTEDNALENFEVKRRTVDIEVGLSEKIDRELPKALSLSVWTEAAWMHLRSHPEAAAEVMALAEERRELRLKVKYAKSLKTMREKAEG